MAISIQVVSLSNVTLNGLIITELLCENELSSNCYVRINYLWTVMWVVIPFINLGWHKIPPHLFKISFIFCSTAEWFNCLYVFNPLLPNAVEWGVLYTFTFVIAVLWLRKFCFAGTSCFPRNGWYQKKQLDCYTKPDCGQRKVE